MTIVFHPAIYPFMFILCLKRCITTLKKAGIYSKISREGSGVAQSVERLAVNQVVAGSSPAAGAIFLFVSNSLNLICLRKEEG